MAILNMITQGRDEGGGNIGEPLNLAVTTSGLDATITWEDNEIGTIPPTSFAKSELVRKVGSAPTSPSDGTLVVTETVKDTYKVSGYIDSGLTDGTTYYYRVFSYSDLGGISYCDAVSVTPSSGWQPGANTVAYYPFDIDFNDYSGNNYNLSNYGNVSISTLDGVDCAEFSSGEPYGLYNNDTSIDIIQGQYTYLVWIYYTGGGTSYPRIFGGTTDWFILRNQGGDYLQPNALTNGGVPISTNTWELIAFTGNLATGAWVGYKNGSYNTSGTGTTGIKYGIRMGGNEGDPYNGTDAFYGGMSNVIFENRQWTAQEIANYYDQTKADYGVS